MGEFSKKRPQFNIIARTSLKYFLIMNKLILVLLMAVATFATISNASPVNRQTREAKPLDVFGALNRGVGFNRRPNQGLKNHGKQKFWTGAGLYGLGAVTGNSGLKNVGGGLVKLGLLTKR